MMVSNSWGLADLPSFFYETLIFLLFGTGLLFVYLYKFDKPDFFVQLYLMTMTVKLIFYGVYNYFMITEDADGALANISWFMLLYITFTIIEIAILHRKISR